MVYQHYQIQQIIPAPADLWIECRNSGEEKYGWKERVICLALAKGWTMPDAKERQEGKKPHSEDYMQEIGEWSPSVVPITDRGGYLDVCAFEYRFIGTTEEIQESKP